MNLLDALTETLTHEEGYINHVYKDSRGILTAGVGFNVDPQHGGSIPDVVIDFWLKVKIQEAEAALDRLLPWWRGQPDSVQKAMGLMCYQIGINGLLGFGKTLAALHAGDYATAQAEARNSDWHKETPARAERVIALFCDPVPPSVPVAIPPAVPPVVA